MKTKDSDKTRFEVLGIMSGTSLDGVDLAFCSFHKKNDHWFYKIIGAETVKYQDDWIKRLSTLENSSALEFAQTDFDFGNLLGLLCRDFLLRYDFKPDFIASHGHTIFHAPEQKMTCQIGKGACIAAVTGYPVVYDFRSLDVALGGQGAPLVPIGDEMLFGNFDYCLNLGGFGNISYKVDHHRIAFDICPVNIALNHYSRLLGNEYDNNGEIAGSGFINEDLVHSLNQISYFQKPAPKSLGKEWFLAEFLPLIENSGLPVADKLRSVCEHIAIQIAKVTTHDSGKKMVITGGGAFNSFLIERIREKVTVEVVLPDPLTINFKEALIFAFLGVLRWRNEPNCLNSVTGATKDNIGGSISSS